MKVSLMTENIDAMIESKSGSLTRFDKDRRHDTEIGDIELTFFIDNVSQVVMQILMVRVSQMSFVNIGWEFDAVTAKERARFTTALQERIQDLKTQVHTETAIDEANLNQLIQYVENAYECVDVLLHSKNSDGEQANSIGILQYFLPMLWPSNFIMSCTIRELWEIINSQNILICKKEYKELCSAIMDTLPDSVKEIVNEPDYRACPACRRTTCLNCEGGECPHDDSLCYSHYLKFGKQRLNYAKD